MQRLVFDLEHNQQSVDSESEVFQNVASQLLLDFTVPRDGLLESIGRIEIDVVSSPVAYELAATTLQARHQFTSLHSAISFTS